MECRRSISSTGRFIVCVLVALALSSCGGGSRMGSPAVTLSLNHITFPDETPGGASPAQAVNVMNSGTATLDISGITAGANFQEIDDCGSQLTAGAVCTLNVTFVPTITGNLAGVITVTDNAPGGTQTISLSGTGVSAGPPPSPTLTGYCFGSIEHIANKCSLVQNVTSCPVGQVAVRPVYESGCLPPTSQLIDASTSCQGTTKTGVKVNGSCVAAN